MINLIRKIIGKFSCSEKTEEIWKDGKSVKRDKYAEGIVDGRAICPDCGEVVVKKEEIIGKEAPYGDYKEAIVITTNRKNVGRNDPCPCGSGKKYKKCCLGTDRDFESTKNIVKCNICNKAFDKRDLGSFASIEQGGKSINFCPECNINLWCSSCSKKLGKKSFNLYSCSDCGAIYVICIDCSERSYRPVHSHAVGYIK